MKRKKEKELLGGFPGGPVVLPVQGVQLQILIGKVRPQVPHGITKKKKKKNPWMTHCKNQLKVIDKQMSKW